MKHFSRCASCQHKLVYRRGVKICPNCNRRKLIKELINIVMDSKNCYEYKERVREDIKYFLGED